MRFVKLNEGGQRSNRHIPPARRIAGTHPGFRKDGSDSCLGVCIAQICPVLWGCQKPGAVGYSTRQVSLCLLGKALLGRAEMWAGRQGSVVLMEQTTLSGWKAAPKRSRIPGKKSPAGQSEGERSKASV